MKVALQFPAGLREESESFVVVYRNQFGVLNWAYRDVDDALWSLFTEEAQRDFQEADGVDGPAGQGAGAFFDEPLIENT